MVFDDEFTPKMGKPRTRGGKVSAGRSYLNSVRKATNLARGGGPQPAKSGLSTSFTGSRIGRGSGAGRVLSSRSGVEGLRQRRVIVKARIVKLSGKGMAAALAHMRYVQRDGVTREGTPGQLYSAQLDVADGRDFIARADGDRHQFRFIVSPEDGVLYDDLKGVTRSLMTQMENDLNTRLDWVAVDHFNTGHPHTHIIVRGRDDLGKDLIIAKEYITAGIRERASEVIAFDLGPRKDSEIEAALKAEVKHDRFTSLDTQLVRSQSEDGLVKVADGDSLRQSLLTGRLHKLEGLGLAEKAGAGTWRLSDDLEPTLRRMGERGDIYKIMADELRRSQRDRALPDALIHDQMPTPEAKTDRPISIVGQVLKRGLSDELNDRHYLMVDAADGRVHYLDIGQGDRVGPTPSNSIVRLTPNVPRLSRADETIAQVAEASGGRYSIDLHLKHDSNARQAFAETHMRRLEAIRRVTGEVERDVTGYFKVGTDYRDIALRYEQTQAQAMPVKVEVLATLSLDQQVKRNAATWLDRELTATEPLALASTGFGAAASQALTSRTQWLVEEGIVTLGKDGQAALPHDLTRTLTRRELNETANQLSKANGLKYVEPREGVSIEGRLKGAVDLASGKFALVERSKEFTLVPWREVLTKHIGKDISGIHREHGTNWSMSRGLGRDID